MTPARRIALHVLFLGFGTIVGIVVGRTLHPAWSQEAARNKQEQRRLGIALMEAERARDQAEKKSAELQRQLSATQDALAATLAAPRKPAEDGPPAAEPEAVDPKKAFSDMVLRIGQSQVKGQIEGRLGVLTERLGLTAAQEGAVKKVLEAEAAAAAAALDRLMAGQGTPADFGRLARLRRGQLPAGVEPVLTADQQGAYEAFKEQERISSVENRISLELSGLVAAGGLTPEQKDQAFAKLGDLVMAEDATDFDSMKQAAEVRAYVDDATNRRLEALDPILTEPQRQMYRQQVDMSREVLARLMPTDSP